MRAAGDGNDAGRGPGPLQAFGRLQARPMNAGGADARAAAGGGIAGTALPDAQAAAAGADAAACSGSGDVLPEDDFAAPRRCTHLLYLHGFRSSPQSTKARIVADWLARHRPDVVWHCPQLPPSPAEALRGVLDRIAGWPQCSSGVIGSSLGGWYAGAVAERLPGCRATLLNPAVHPARDLAKYIGELTAFHDESERFWFRAEYVDELRALDPGGPTRPGRYLAVVAKGDEVLDWREMAARYAGCRLRLVEGGDHALSDFGQAHLPEVVRFLGLA